MLIAERPHLAPSHASALKQDEKLRLWAEELSGELAGLGSVGETVRRLREHGDYWRRVQTGRLRAVKVALARLMQPFFKNQIRYNLQVAEHLGRIEVVLGDLRRDVAALRLAIDDRTEGDRR